MLKVLGCAVLFFCGVLISEEIKKHAAIKLERLEALLELVRTIQLQIDCYALPIPEIIHRLDRDLLNRCKVNRPEINTLKELYQELKLSSESPEGAIMAELCNNIGYGYRDSEVKLCERCINGLQDVRDEYKSELPKQNKLSATLCYCVTGIIIMIFV